MTHADDATILEAAGLTDDGTPARPANKPATLAMIAGLLSFLPGVGFVAIGFGLAGGNVARVNGGAGRGRAFTGVVLGIAGLMIWAMLVGAYFEIQARRRALPAVEATKRFILLVGSGQVAAAKAYTTDKIDVDTLTDTAEEFQKLGGFTGDVTAYAGKPIGEGVQVDYRLPFVGGAKIFSGDWVFEAGKPKLDAYRMTAEPVETTQPAKGK